MDLNLRKTNLTKSDMELVSFMIGENPKGPCKITRLCLSKNNLTKDGAKALGPGLMANKSLVSLDLSGCKLGASGVVALCDAIKSHSGLKSLNLYRNILDVDGARALGDCLSKDKSVEFLDVGYNRIRKTGLKAIVDGVCSNPNSKLVSLGLRSNFINDDGFSYLFEKMVTPEQHRLKEIFVRGNFLSEYHKIALYKSLNGV